MGGQGSVKSTSSPNYSFSLNTTGYWIDHGLLQSGPTLAFSLWLSNFKTKTRFGFLIKKIRGRFYIFFEKSKNELVRPKMVFLAILAKCRLIFDNSDIEEISQNTSVYRVQKYEFKDLCKKSIDRTSYHLLCFSISIDLD